MWNCEEQKKRSIAEAFHYYAKGYHDALNLVDKKENYKNLAIRFYQEYEIDEEYFPLDTTLRLERRIRNEEWM
jgi:hypothetical protein